MARRGSGDSDSIQEHQSDINITLKSIRTLPSLLISYQLRRQYSSLAYVDGGSDADGR